MGKRILQRHRGKGGIQYRAPQIGKFAKVRYPFIPEGVTAELKVLDIVHERGRAYPLAEVDYSGKRFYLPAVAGTVVGSQIQIGPQAAVTTGNILPLANIPEGSSICNIERYLGDGGKLVRQAGESAILFANTPQGSTIRMPSGRTAFLSPRCRASLGIVSGGGRTDKPFLRAGAKYHLMKSKGKAYPRMRGIAMAAVYHPFGGGRHQHPGKSTSTSRNAPPGRKVGHIAPRKTGRKRIPRVENLSR
ncbi:MAG: 50S ribosomal protein L2 [Thaumarchaeota archaeon]|nr:50S ribosomal protein L2 [Nitrososphaerota archaeon]